MTRGSCNTSNIIYHRSRIYWQICETGYDRNVTEMPNQVWQALDVCWRETMMLFTILT